MGRYYLLKLFLIVCFATCIFSFNFKSFISSLETPFIKEKPKHSLKLAETPQEVFIQKIQPIEPSENADQLVQVSRRSKIRSHQMQDPKLESITKTMDGLNDQFNSRMEKDYKQCIQTVSNFNCSYSEEWKHLKLKHKKNITNMQEEIKAKDDTIALIKTQVQKKSVSKNLLIKQILPEISQIEKDIGQLELILELIGEAFDKTEKQQSAVIQPAPQILIKTKNDTEKPNKPKNASIEQKQQDIHKKDLTKEKQMKETEEQQIAINLSKEKQIQQKKQNQLDSAEQELKELMVSEQQDKKQKTSENSTKEEESIKNQQKNQEEQESQQQTIKIQEQKQEILQDSTPLQANEDNNNLFISADEAVENLEEQYDKDNSKQINQFLQYFIQVNDLLDDIQNRNLFDDAHIFMQTKMNIKSPKYSSVFDKPHYQPQKSISSQILNSQLVSDEDKESLWIIANEESHSANLHFESQRISLKTILDFIQKSSIEQFQDSLDVKLIQGKIVEQQNELAPMMKTKLLTLRSQLKAAKEEKENQIKTLEDLIQSEYQVYAQKIFSIQVEKHKLVEEIQKKQDWINQLESKITDCENQDIMLTNCENAKEQDIAYLKELEEFKAIAEGSLEQIGYLLDYKNIPIIAQKPEIAPAQQKQPEKEQKEAEQKQVEANNQEPEESKKQENQDQEKENEAAKQQVFIEKHSKANSKLKKSKDQSTFSMIQNFDDSPFIMNFDETNEVPNYVSLEEPPMILGELNSEKSYLKKKIKKNK